MADAPANLADLLARLIPLHIRRLLLAGRAETALADDLRRLRSFEIHGPGDGRPTAPSYDGILLPLPAACSTAPDLMLLPARLGPDGMLFAVHAGAAQSADDPADPLAHVFQIPGH